MTVLNLVLNIVFIRGLGPDSGARHQGRGGGNVHRVGHHRWCTRSWKLWSGTWVVKFPRGQGFGPDWAIIRSLFRFGLPSGIQGIAMNVGGTLMLAFIGSVAQGRGGAGGVRDRLLAALLAHHVDVGRTHGRGGRGRRPEPRRRAIPIVPTRPCTSPRASASSGAAIIGAFFLFLPRQLLGVFGMNDPAVLEIGAQLLRVLERLRTVHHASR